MKTIARVLVFGALLSVGSTHALTVAYITEGPMMRNARLAKFVGPQIGGPITALADLDKGGTHRLSVRLNSKYFSEDKSFLYMIEFDVQQGVTDRGSEKLTLTIHFDDSKLTGAEVVQEQGAKKSTGVTSQRALALNLRSGRLDRLSESSGSWNGPAYSCPTPGKLRPR